MKRSIIITGSEGFLGKEISNYFEKNSKVHKLDLSLGHDLTDEKFVKEWFSKNHANYLINCFAVNDNITKKRKRNTLFNFSLESFQDYLNVNLVSLFSVCREFAKNNKKVLSLIFLLYMVLFLQIRLSMINLIRILAIPFQKQV